MGRLPLAGSAAGHAVSSNAGRCQPGGAATTVFQPGLAEVIRWINPSPWRSKAAATQGGWPKLPTRRPSMAMTFRPFFRMIGQTAISV